MKHLHFQISFILITLLILQGSAQEICFDHSSMQIEGINGLKLEEGLLSFQCAGPVKGFLVIKSDNPLRLEPRGNIEALLVPGWDGSLGYKMYGLRLNVRKAGLAEVYLNKLEPPATPVVSTDKEIEQFKVNLEKRSSKFPGGVAGFQSWQECYRDSLIRTLMGGGFPQRVPADLLIHYEKDYPLFRLISFSYQSRVDRRNTALLSIPKTVGNAPLLVALHGHETTWGTADSAAFREGHIDDFCAYFANRGWAVLQPASMDHKLQHLDWTLQGEWSWDAITAIDVCASYPSINMDKVAVCGLSTGAHLAMNLLALDSRVKAGVVACILSTWNHYEKRFRIPPHCDCGICKQLSPLMEQCDWAVLAAPKPVQFQHGLMDPSFCPGADESLLDLKWNTGILPTEEYNAMFSEVYRAYGIFELKDNVSTSFHDGQHSVNNEKALQWLMKVL